MPVSYLAKFRLQLAPGTVETVDGYKIVRGCKVLETGGTARVKVGDAVLAVERDKDLSEKLLALAEANGGIINAHFTHDWTEGNADPLNYDAGFWDSFHVDGKGDLLADLNLAPSKHQDQILFNAQKNPKGAMVSAIFKFHTYEKEGKFHAEPFQFISADIVRKGEATTALFSATKLDAEKQTTQKTRMPFTKEEIEELVTSPEFTAVLSSAIKTALPAAPDATAILAAAKPDIAKQITEGIEAAKPEILKQAEANAVAKIGTARLSSREGGANDQAGETAYFAKVKEYTQGGKVNAAVAEMRVASDFPELYEAHRAGIFKSKTA